MTLATWSSNGLSVSENETDLKKVELHLLIFEVIVEGYDQITKDFLVG